MVSPYRKKFSTTFIDRELRESELAKLNRIYYLQLLSSEKRKSNKENKLIDNLVLNFDCVQRATKTYTRRWFLFAMITISLTISSTQFLQFCIISNVIQKYFDTTSDVIDLTSIFYMLIYFLLYIPVTYFFCEKQSLHKVALYGSVGLVITSWLKYVGVLIQNFALILLVQCFCALFHIFLSSIPSRIATVWFPIQEEYLTQAITIFANNLGLIINFLSLIVINNLDDMEILTTNLTDYILLIALLSTFNAIIMMFAFKQDEPEIPPSCIEALRRDKVIQNEDFDKRRFWKSLKILMSNKNFIMLFLGFGLNIGVFNAFSTILNSIIVHYFPTGQLEAGTLCLSTTLLSVFSLFGFAFILARFKRFKSTALWILRIQSIAFILFSLSLESTSFVIMCFSSILLGIFMVGFQLVGQELAVELTYDMMCEDISVGIINTFGFFCGIIITLGIKKLQDVFSILYGNLCFSLLITVGTIFNSLISSLELKRQEVVDFIDSATEIELESRNYRFSDTPRTSRQSSMK
ncbi:choline/ethanolamine transporter flvcr2a-like [Chironomus tepperi]|uniref:choline/ethanolamine transporter flvcr2a-like n=1 Tax=Chironomus tepperi TaxID=113505 RepID=UPI00391EE225